MSELIKALIKERRYRDNPELKIPLKRDIIEEIADVSIMIEQLKLIFNCRDEVNRQVEYKLRRVLNRMNEEE